MSKQESIKKIILTEIVPTVIIMFLLFGVILKIAVVNGESMYPTLHSGAVVIFNLLFYRNPEQGDIISFKENGQNYIKRVIGTEGDIVDIDFESGTVFVNGIALEEKYVNEANHTSYDKKFPITEEENLSAGLKEETIQSHIFEFFAVGVFAMRIYRSNSQW